MRREAALARAYEVLVVADGVDFRVGDRADGLEVVGVAEHDDWGRGGALAGVMGREGRGRWGGEGRGN
jgi:hypothetical protein